MSDVHLNDVEQPLARAGKIAAAIADLPTPKTWDYLFTLGFGVWPEPPARGPRCEQCRGPMPKPENHQQKNRRRCPKCRERLGDEGWRVRVKRHGLEHARAMGFPSEGLRKAGQKGGTTRARRRGQRISGEP